MEEDTYFLRDDRFPGPKVGYRLVHLDGDSVYAGIAGFRGKIFPGKVVTDPVGMYFITIGPDHPEFFDVLEYHLAIITDGRGPAEGYTLPELWQVRAYNWAEGYDMNHEGAARKLVYTRDVSQLLEHPKVLRGIRQGIGDLYPAMEMVGPGPDREPDRLALERLVLNHPVLQRLVDYAETQVHESKTRRDTYRQIAEVARQDLIEDIVQRLRRDQEAAEIVQSYPRYD